MMQILVLHRVRGDLNGRLRRPVKVTNGTFQVEITSRATLEASDLPPEKMRLRPRPRSGLPTASIGASREGTNCAIVTPCCLTWRLNRLGS